jgi:GUN4-like
LTRAITRHNEGTARVIPIILSSCDWNIPEVPFSKLSVLPTHARPITSWSNQEDAFTIVAKGIRAVVDQLRAEKLTKQQTAEQQEQQQFLQKTANQQAITGSSLGLQSQKQSTAIGRGRIAGDSIPFPLQISPKAREVYRGRIAGDKTGVDLSRFSSNGLSSERGIDYTRLQDLLKTADWKGADQETRNIVFTVCNRSHGETLESEDIRQSSDSAFLVIDQLWSENSKGHFGFSSQQAILYRFEDFSGVTYKIFQRFSQSVGWYKGDSWIKYESLDFSLNAPVGHFPYSRSWITPTRPAATAQRFHALMLKLKSSTINL